MKRFSVDALDFEVAELFGERVLFNELRVQRESVPKGLRLYELRHEDEDDAFPCQIADGIPVNFYGSVLTSRPVQLLADGRLDLLRDDFGYADDEMTVKEYLAQYPPEDSDIMELSIFQTAFKACSLAEARKTTGKTAVSDICAVTSATAERDFMPHGGRPPTVP